MERWTGKTYIAAVGIVCLSLLLWKAYPVHPQTQERLQPMVAVDSGLAPEETAQWAKEIETQGAPAAYQKLLQDTAGLSDSQQHFEAHVFGRALYQEKGIDGFTICDPAELFGGCEHEFLAEAVQDLGVSIVPALNATCITRYGERRAVTCQHGMGHGLVNFFGYDIQGLKQSLVVCDTIQSIDQIEGCYGGSFMEFNLRTIVDNKLRDFTPEEPFALCKEVSATQRPACYFWTPQWIFGSLYDTTRTPETFSDVGAYCSTVSAADLRYACFQGIGYFAPPSSNFNEVRAKELCDAVSSAQKDKDDCWSIAKVSF